MTRGKQTDLPIILFIPQSGLRPGMLAWPVLMSLFTFTAPAVSSSDKAEESLQSSDLS
jgi:hypothetical protein